MLLRFRLLSPANSDLATRPMNAQNLAESEWLTGPKFLRTTSSSRKERLEIPLNVSDPEVRKEIVAFTTQSSKRCGLGAERFSRFSSLHSLQRAIANLIVSVKERSPGKQGSRTRERKKCKPSEESHSKGTSASNHGHSPHCPERLFRSWAEPYSLQWYRAIESKS